MILKATILFLGIFLACAEQSHYNKNCFESIENLKSELLNKNISVLKGLEACYLEKIIEMEDEEDNTLKWKNYQFFKGNVISFVAETSWENNESIQRITIYDTSLKYAEDIFVGQSFKYFRQKIKYAFWDESLGLFYVKTSKDDEVAIELKTLQNAELKEWEKDLINIPENVKVESIIINDTSTLN